MSEHFLQSKYWREIQEINGSKTYDFNGGWFQTTDLPLGLKIGYLPKVDIKNLNLDSLYESAKKSDCSYITVDFVNNIEEINKINSSYRTKKVKSVQLQNNVEIDLLKSEDDLFADFKKDYRNYTRRAIKEGVEVRFSNSEEAFENFIKIYLDTKERHKYPGRTEQYIRNVWKVFRANEKDGLNLVTIATAYFVNKPLVSWMLISYKDTVYYPYGGSLDVHREKYPTYLTAWEVIKWSKQSGYSTFDFMGIEENTMQSGFSKFKLGFGGKIVKYSDSIDLIINPLEYNLEQIMIALRKATRK